MARNQIFNLALLAVAVLEFLFLFVFFPTHITTQEVNAVGYFLCSVTFGILLMAKCYNRLAVPNPVRQPLPVRITFLVLFALCFLAVNYVTNGLIKDIDYRSISDIIPTITILVKRFLAGLPPYTDDSLVSLYYHTPSSYLPMHWLPCVPAEYFHFDYRKMTFIVWCIGSGIMLARGMKGREPWLAMLLPLLLSAGYVYVALNVPNVIAVTVEIMVGSYYMLLLCGINMRNAWLMGFFLACCLLSRYMVAFWLPLWAMVLFVTEERKYLFRTAASAVFIVAILYIIPFLSHDWTSFYRAYINNYDVAPFGEWKHLDGNGLPFHLFAGIGMACFFYKHYLATDLFAGYLLMKKLFFIINGLVILTLGIWFWVKRSRINSNIFLMASFKVYLSFFISFLVLPYQYFALTSVFVSLAIFSEQLRYDVAPRPTNK